MNITAERRKVLISRSFLAGVIVAISLFAVAASLRLY
jgi:hypothetical protein